MKSPKTDRTKIDFSKIFFKEFVIKGCREFFFDKNYHELEVPIITKCLPTERYLEPFSVGIKKKDKFVDIGYLLPTTERFNKIALSKGIKNHFVITKVARAMEEESVFHHNEFTMLEWYQLNSNYFDLMQECEELILFLIKFVLKEFKKEFYKKEYQISIPQNISNNNINFQGNLIDISMPWYRISLPEAIKKFTGLSVESFLDFRTLKTFLKKNNIRVLDEYDWQFLFEILFSEFVKENLPKDKPVFVYDYPQKICVLTKSKSSNAKLCERVELFISGIEIANGYTELLDYKKQEKFFKREEKARNFLKKIKINYDYELIDSLKNNIPDVAGIGMGLDRLVMILSNSKSISEINLF